MAEGERKAEGNFNEKIDSTSWNHYLCTHIEVRLSYEWKDNFEKVCYSLNEINQKINITVVLFYVRRALYDLNSPSGLDFIF